MPSSTRRRPLKSGARNPSLHSQAANQSASKRDVRGAVAQHGSAALASARGEREFRGRAAPESAGRSDGKRVVRGAFAERASARDDQKRGGPKGVGQKRGGPKGVGQKRGGPKRGEGGGRAVSREVGRGDSGREQRGGRERAAPRAGGLGDSGRGGSAEQVVGGALQGGLRSSLAQRGGAITTQGDPALCAELEAALAAADSDETNDLTHGFHTYPARMHPRLARELVARFSEAEDVVLDPFCGSGTVLVEALVAGRKPQGVDLNPLALRISEAHCALRTPAARRRFERLLVQVAEASEERVRTRARAHIAIDRDTQAFYQPHVLFELCGLREEIEVVPDETERRALLFVFSALLIKFSRKRADTSGDVVDKRIRKGLVTEFFARKGHELSLRWEALFEAAPRDAFPARLVCGDARELKRLLGESFRADLIATSPPYGGTYDYARHHAIRNAWFGFDTERLQEREIGARRTIARAPRGAERWDDELLAVLRAMREVSGKNTRIILWMGDADIGGRHIAADEQVADLAPHAALELKAAASQPRQDPRGGPDRLERLLLLETLPR